MFVSTTHSDEKRTFSNKLQRLRCDLESFMLKVDAPYPDITETEKRRYCCIVIELLEFAVKRAENLPVEVSFSNLPTWNNLQKENRILKKQVHTLNTEQMRLSVLLESANRNIRELQETDSQTTEDTTQTTEDTHEDLRSGLLLSRELDNAYKSLFAIEEVSSRMEKDSTPREIPKKQSIEKDSTPREIPRKQSIEKAESKVLILPLKRDKMEKPVLSEKNESPRNQNRDKTKDLKTILKTQETNSTSETGKSKEFQDGQKTLRASFSDFSSMKTTNNPKKRHKEYEKHLQNTIANLKEQNSHLVKQNEYLQAEVNRLMKEKMADTPRNETEEKELLELRSQVQGLWKLVQTLETERKYLLNRLGRLVNSHVGEDENGDTQTFMADLSDLIRPTALTLHLSELYNNEWILAYESMISKVFNERKVVADLLSCMTNIYLKCKDMAEKQRRQLHRDSKLVDGLLNPDNLLEVPIQIIELQRERVLEDLPEIKKTCRSILTNLKSYPKQVIRFFDRCTELCWFMNVHHPPLVLEWRIPQGSLVDTSRFTFYTRSGHYVDYVVWPALLLSEEGAILSKGVVQGRG
ncbi:uncharacterized protein LOC133175659 [Saccostrea echinata]|uniref:uncharacterized protein LOC133175659 n=1 Tax=Saccostrea echinata TaxID=191078 RepID=UPI002A815076|nr:uncharacterized protein LOC133175659 [Saccostrea echinata]